MYLFGAEYAAPNIGISILYLFSEYLFFHYLRSISEMCKTATLKKTVKLVFKKNYRLM